jgi:F0F1-type ATP synthase assembly protein I
MQKKNKAKQKQKTKLQQKKQRKKTKTKQKKTAYIESVYCLIVELCKTVLANIMHGIILGLNHKHVVNNSVTIVMIY